MNIQQFCKMFVVSIFMIVLLSTMSPAQEAYQIYAPPTPSSIPLIIAAQNMENVNLTIFSNHSQANTLFLRGDVPILSTGLSVGINFYKNDVPVQIVNSYVSGLSYLVTRDKKIESFGEIKGQNIYLPFEGSPIEEITRFFVQQEGLDLKKDFQVVYSQFPASLELLKRGKADNVVLPQPLAIIAAAQDDIFLSFAY